MLICIGECNTHSVLQISLKSAWKPGQRVLSFKADARYVQIRRCSLVWSMYFDGKFSFFLRMKQSIFKRFSCFKRPCASFSYHVLIKTLNLQLFYDLHLIIIIIYLSTLNYFRRRCLFSPCLQTFIIVRILYPLFNRMSCNLF